MVQLLNLTNHGMGHIGRKRVPSLELSRKEFNEHFVRCVTSVTPIWRDL